MIRAKKILKLLGVNDQPAATDLRREMDDPKSRRGQGHDATTTDVPPLFDILYLWSLLRKACSAEFSPEAAGRARVSGRDAAFAGWQ